MLEKTYNIYGFSFELRLASLKYDKFVRTNFTQKIKVTGDVLQLRLMIFLKKAIKNIADTILFDQNVNTTWLRFRAEADRVLSSVQTRLGLVEYKVVLDESTTTPDLIDRNILYAKIFLKPARAIEYIAIDFNISNTGAAFDD